MIKVTMTTINNFKDLKSYIVWKRAMQLGYSIVDFEALEKDGKLTIQSGTEKDGSVTNYTYEEAS